MGVKPGLRDCLAQSNLEYCIVCSKFAIKWQIKGEYEIKPVLHFRIGQYVDLNKDK
jgi:hypothetical protein